MNNIIQPYNNAELQTLCSKMQETSEKVDELFNFILLLNNYFTVLDLLNAVCDADNQKN